MLPGLYLCLLSGLGGFVIWGLVANIPVLLICTPQKKNEHTHMYIRMWDRQKEVASAVAAEANHHWQSIYITNSIEFVALYLR